MAFGAVFTDCLPAAESKTGNWAGIQTFIEKNCFDCHQGKDPEAGLDLEKLGTDLSQKDVLARWVHVFDRVEHGEMPPRDYDAPPKADMHAFLESARSRLLTSEHHRYETLGRVQARRLTNLQLERTLHDLLGIDIPLAIACIA